MLPQPGDLVGGKYRIIRLIGDGGMGSVYEARHEGLGLFVALKFLHEDLAERPGLAERFLQEARVAATIRSQHVAHVTDVDVGPGGQPYLVMELLSGESLQDVLDRERKLAPAVAIDYALQIAAGLEAAHAVGVVHRDLKPDNVFVTPGTGGPLLKLIDFGIAKLAAGPNGRGLTRAGVVMGTAEYMPPEQLYAAHDVDGRADVYALGVMLFEMLSGRRPADGDDAQVIVNKVLTGDVLSLASLEPSLSPVLVDLVRHATAGDREDRTRSAAELRAALATLATDVSQAGALAARATPQPPAPAAARTAVPAVDNSFAKGATAQAPPVPAPYAAVPARLPSPPPPSPGARRARARGRGVWVALLVAVAAAGAGIAGYAVLSTQTSALPPPPPEAVVAPPAQAFTPEGEASTFTPPPPAPGTPSTPPTSRRGVHGTEPTPTATATTTATATPDAGTFPIPLKIPSTFPPIPLPSGFPTALPTSLPTALPSGLPTAFPTSFPHFPGFPPLPAPTTPSGHPDGGP